MREEDEGGRRKGVVHVEGVLVVQVGWVMKEEEGRTREEDEGTTMLGAGEGKEIGGRSGKEGN